MQVACPTRGVANDIPDHVHEWLWENAEHVTAPPGSYIIKQCQKEPRVHYLVEGRIKISIFLPGGSEKTLCILEPGNMLGEVSAFYIDAYPISAVALQHSMLKSWSADFVHKAISEYPSLAPKVMASIAKKLSILATQVESLCNVTSRQRVADLFIHLAQVYGVKTERGLRIALRLTQQDLANLAGTSRVSVSNSFRHFKSLGLVNKTRGRYYVHDLERLRTEGSGTADVSRLADASLLPAESVTA